MSTTTSLAGRSALVTGSTDGIGAAIAAELAAAGAHVVVSGRDAGRGAEVTRVIGAAGGRATFVPADLAAGAPAVQALADAARAAVGGVPDILVNNAAMLITPKPTAEVGEAVITAALAVNVTATFLLTGAIAPAMAARSSGAVINIGSINGLVGMDGSALYSATKAAVHSLTKSWAAEYGPAGVRVNTVAPGPTLTRRIEQYADRVAPLVARAPSRRPSRPAEIGRVVVFLAGDDAANIHGATLSVDGGWSAV
ncbi:MULTISPECIES: SDR family NAD(P)-dependent oxidoreductase [Frankia]|uniref:Oxidoreductase n=1 Tax=Frankia alni (strain DSM 45986 / CECT 9034 / ACN14a) TaxID=326424 RepID=Q0RGN0_FRAAA|nr:MULTISPECIES: SDR family oxidoreductase [Frankia]CAJ63357.1 Putative oxidoreductase [Frankia alni ACN14a]